MTFDSKDLSHLLERTDLHIPFKDFIEIAIKTYSVNKIYSYTPILT